MTSIAAPMRRVVARRNACLAHRPEGTQRMLRMSGLRPSPIVSVLIGIGLVVVGLIVGKILPTAVGAVAAVIGLVGAFGGRSGGANGGPR
jgi:VIT1/CCC1 family predicted Fe2+/Mn2+ transporter